MKSRHRHANRAPGLTRRSFLKGLGGAAATLPMMSLLGTSAYAADGVFPKRLVIMFSANGTVRDEWTPNGTGSSFTLGRILDPLEAYRQQMLVLSGIHHKTCMEDRGNGHARGMSGMLTCRKMEPVAELNNGFGDIGYAGGISIDQEIANAVGQETRFKSLEFGVQTARSYGEHPYSRMSYAAASQPMPAMDDPAQAFDRIFAPLFANGEDLGAKRAQRKSVLDFVAGDYGRAAGQLGSDDKQKLEQHMTFVRDIERQIDSPGQLGGSCAPPEVADSINFEARAEYPNVGRMQMDMLAMSMACDLTRVATLQWSSAQSGVNHSGWTPAGDRSHHGTSHETDGASIASLVEINRWYAQQLKYLCDRFSEIPEGDGTMLDNTAILWCSEVGVGNNHTYRGMPYVTMGSCGGYFDTGRHVDYGDDEPPTGNLFVSLMHAMDVDGDRFGDPDWCSGEITGLV